MTEATEANGLARPTSHQRDSSFPVSFSSAGLRPEDHYNKVLPAWRAKIRSVLLPNIRKETKILSEMQQRVRTPFLDVYFANTSNLGTHTFFMVMLPVIYWFGYGALIGRGLTFVVATGVFFSGYVKDMICLPRVPSPPMVRLTMSGSHHLEYGFPSTHSTNAMGISLFFIFLIQRVPAEELSTTMRYFYYFIIFLYAFSIVYGRLYTGMHSITDVVGGCIIGIVLGYMEDYLHASIDKIITGNNFAGGSSSVFAMSDGTALMLLCITIVILVRVHPEPVENCPCFDDNVAFAGVMLGLWSGIYLFQQTPFVMDDMSIGDATYTRGNVAYSYAYLGLFKSVARVVSGVIGIFIWRMTAKKVLGKVLPSTYRWLDRNFFLLPRKFYASSTTEKERPKQPKRRMTLTPSVIHLPMMPKDSIGPQSESDVLEQMDNPTVTPTKGPTEVQAPPPRRDVDVASKLIVYAGIGFMAVCGVPVAFEYIGLGARQAFP